MTQYVFTMTSRMVAIAASCVVLLCILLFLMGVEIGKQWATHTKSPNLSPPNAAPGPPPPPPATEPKAQPSTS